MSMPGSAYYDITALPAAGELGSAPAVAPAVLLGLLADTSRSRLLVEAVLLYDDLIVREALLCGEIDEVNPIVLSSAQLRGEAPLPDELAAGSVAGDALWESYFRHVARVGHSVGSRFVPEWVGYEVALRNALARVRAERLGLEAHDPIVVPGTDDPDASTDDVLAAWSAAATPLAAMHVIIEARWGWVSDHDRWYSFTDDEFAAYAVKISLLRQWRRISNE